MTANRLSVFALTLLSLFGIAHHGRAATVGPAGYTNAFTAQPAAGDWATVSQAGAGGDSYTSDSDVNANMTASLVNWATVSDPGNPPTQNTNALWTSSGLFLATRPTGNRYTALMGKFVNASGTNATRIALSYSLTIAGTVAAEDAGKGTRVYFSLSGLANSWTNLASLNTTATSASTTAGTNLTLNWTNGGTLYLLWADDNANGGLDVAYEIDNFSLQVTAGVAPFFAVTVNAPTNNALILSGTTINAAASVVFGTPPYTVEYFTNSGLGNTAFASAGSNATAPYSVPLGALPAATYNIYAVVTDGAATPLATNSLTNTFFVADPIGFALTTPADGASYDNATTVTGAATVSGGSAPYSVQFYLDNVVNGAPVTSAPYEHSFGTLFVGDHSVRATITDARGWISNSLPSAIHVTGPLGVTLTPTNGASFLFGESVILDAIAGGGTPPYVAEFYTNGQMIGTVAAAPFTTNLGTLPVGTYTISVHVVDSSAPTAQDVSAIADITVAPNPLLATLTSPTNGQNGTAGQAVTLSATATVAAPLAVTNVEFFFDGASVGKDATAPYAMSGVSMTAGSHSVYAVASDNLGRTSCTATNQIILAVNPLANDNFANRFPLTGGAVMVTGANAGATTETSEPASSGYWTRWGATLWWSWVAPITGPVQIDTIGSSFNTSLGVYTGSTVSGLTRVVFNDNAAGYSDVSQVSVTAQQGVEYQIQVGGMQPFGGGTSATGNIQLNLQMPPTVALTSPANGSVFTLGTNYFVTANAASAGGTVQVVEFYRNGTFIGSVSNAPYTLLVTNSPPGTNSLAAIVRDSYGLATTSSTINVLVARIGITLVVPVDGTYYAAQSPIVVTALTNLPTGSITNIDFYADGQKIGYKTSSPFSITWSNVPSGPHRLTAIGIADAGLSYTSQPVNIAVAFTLVATDSTWQYLDDGSDQGTNWIQPNFNDSAWASGPAPLGYGDSGGRPPATTNYYGPDNANKFITTYYRQTFVASNVDRLIYVYLALQRDDGLVVYLNGSELGRWNMPTGPVTYVTAANSATDDGTNTYTGGYLPTVLREGTNVFAVEVHQDAGNSSDIWFLMTALGLPAIIVNEPPSIALVQPFTNTWHVAPSTLRLEAAASDSDGTVTNVEFFLGATSLGSVPHAPFLLDLPNVPAGTYTYSAVATDDQGAQTASAPETVHVYEVRRRWVAYNDQSAGPGTHPYTTLWDAFGTNNGAPGNGGALRDIATGTALSANLTILADGAIGAPLIGVLVDGFAFDYFDGYVDLGAGAPNDTILIGGTSVVRHVFTGLDPTRRYSFRGTVVGGVAADSNRWTLCLITGADSFAPAHTSNVLTSAVDLDLDSNEAALNTGDNRSGDVVGWDNIAPGADGTFTIVSSQYLGAAPGNAEPGPSAYAFVAVRLEELGAAPLVQITEPLDGHTVEGPTNVTLTAAVSAVETVTDVQFVAEGSIIGSASANPYTVQWNNAPFGTHSVTAVATDAQGLSSTSAPVTVTITIPPTNTVPPMIFAQTPAGDATITNLTSIQVVFSERVSGVNAADLLINDLPAASVSGGGSNYTFTVVQPAYGVVTVRWAAGHGVTDFGWPENLAFDENGPGASWQYTLIDRTPPILVAKNPPANAALTNLTQITVAFSETVMGLNASDLLINGTPAYDLAGSGSNYTFSFSQPLSGTVNITWSASHGITDVASAQNPFNATGAGATWSYTLDSKVVLVDSNSFWFFAKGTNEVSSPVTAWRLPGFDDSHWSNAPAPFFYGDPYSNGVPAYTWLSDMRSNYSSIYLRKTFVVANAGGITNLYLRGQIDDGMIVWINGVEVLRTAMDAGEIPYNGTATNTVTEPNNNGVATVTYALPDPRAYLVAGTNVIAVHAFNESLTTSTDFGFNAQLFAYLADADAVAPHITTKTPAVGYLVNLTNITVTFSEPVKNVDAADLLVNGVPATSEATSSNVTFSFSFPQPAYGVISITWAMDHGITDLDVSPKPFDAALAGSTWQYTLINSNSPYLVSVIPAQSSSITQLTQITMTFSEPVTGVDAGDLLINGVPATSSSGAAASYTFTVLQPQYGTVAVTWAAGHGIRTLGATPIDFDPLWPAHNWTYSLNDKIPPTVVSQTPPAAATVSNLTQLTVVFSEPVSDVDASDLLISGKIASGVTGTNATYTFTFTTPNASSIDVAWTASHGIRDLATSPNPFDATAPGATWSYSAIDTVPPTPSMIPAPSSTVRSLTQIKVTFDEPVSGVEAADLLVNSSPAQQVSGSGAGPYTFTFTQPATGVVQVALSGIQDLAAVPNLYPGSNWTYVLNTNLALPAVTRGPYLQLATPTSIIVRWRTGTASDSRVRFGSSTTSLDFSVEDSVQTTEHIVTVSNLLPYTTYYYAVGTTYADIAGGADDYYLRTFPTNPVPTRIWFVSDFGFKNADERTVRESYFNYIAQTKPADVWITGGDNDQTDGQDANYSESVFGSTYGYAPLLRHQPVFPTIGNHDYQTSQGASYYANFSLPTKGESGGTPSGTEHYYSFNYGDVHFVSLDSVDGTLSQSTNTAMLQWLREDLNVTTQRWVIAYWHGPPYTKGSHDSDDNTDTLSWMVRMRQNVVPTLEAYGVDLVLCGHSHVYERTWLLNGHYGYSSTFSQTNKLDSGDGKLSGTGAYRQNSRGLGTVYITAAVGGQPRNVFSTQHPAHLLKKTGILGSLCIDVAGDRLDCQYLNTSGQAEDYFTLIKGAEPALGVAASPAGTAAAVSWPLDAAGCELQYSPVCGATATWQAVTSGINTNGPSKVFNFVPTAGTPAGFFRLQRR